MLTCCWASIGSLPNARSRTRPHPATAALPCRAARSHPLRTAAPSRTKAPARSHLHEIHEMAPLMAPKTAPTRRVGRPRPQTGRRVGRSRLSKPLPASSRRPCMTSTIRARTIAMKSNATLRARSSTRSPEHRCVRTRCAEHRRVRTRCAEHFGRLRSSVCLRRVVASTSGWL